MSARKYGTVIIVWRGQTLHSEAQQRATRSAEIVIAISQLIKQSGIESSGCKSGPGCSNIRSFDGPHTPYGLNGHQPNIFPIPVMRFSLRIEPILDQSHGCHFSSSICHYPGNLAPTFPCSYVSKIPSFKIRVGVSRVFELGSG